MFFIFFHVLIINKYLIGPIDIYNNQLKYITPNILIM